VGFHRNDLAVAESCLEACDLSLFLAKAPAGFEPGMADLQSESARADCSGITGNPSDRAESLAEIPFVADADLRRVIDAWPRLSDPIRRAVLALVGSTGANS
jgi:hypothetical protein